MFSANPHLISFLSDNQYTDEDILSKVHKKSKASPDMSLDSIHGTDLTPVQKFRIELVNDHIKKLSSNIQRHDKLIDLMIEPYEDYISFLCQIPGVSRNSAITILSEISVDMNQFTSTRRLTSWADLTPYCNQSAGKKKSVRISRAGVYLKPCLVEVVHAAVKDKNHLCYANKFNKILKRRRNLESCRLSRS